MEKFQFNPAIGFNDSNVFHDPENEAETREQLQKLHNQTRDFINKMLIVYGDDAVLLRINAAKGLEFSVDGEHFDEIVGRGERGPAGPGVIPGGTAGQFYRKKSDDDYDGEWTDIPEASDTELGAVKVNGSTSSSISKRADGTIVANRLRIDTLQITDAPVQTLSEPMWFDLESEFLKYIDVSVEGCVESAEPSNFVFDTAFDKKCGYVQCLDGVLRFILKTDIEDIAISTTVKDILIKYQDQEASYVRRKK